MLSFIVTPAMVGVMGVARISAGLDAAVNSICSGSNATTDIETVRVLLFGVLAFELASALCLRASRVAPVRGGTYFSLPPQRKVGKRKRLHTANSSVCLRAPKGSYASHGNHMTHVRCQRSCGASHPLHAPASPHAVPDISLPPRWQTVCRP